MKTTYTDSTINMGRAKDDGAIQQHIPITKKIAKRL